MVIFSIVAIAIIALLVSRSDHKKTVTDLMGTVIALMALPLSIIYIIDRYDGVTGNKEPMIKVPLDIVE